MLNLAKTNGLFENFEVNREPLWPRIARLLGGSILFHAVLVACVVFIPPVRNALSITAMFSGAGFVERPYSKTQITDEADIVELTTEKFHYPEGYFAMDQQAAPSPQLLATAAFTTKGFRPLHVEQPSPVPTPSPLPLASPLAAIAANSGAASKPTPTPVNQSGSTKNADDKAQKELEEASRQTGIDLPQEGDVNKKPFKDLAVYATDLKNQGKLDLDQPFEIVIDTELDKNGKLINPKVTKKEGDPNLIDLAGKLVAAMNDSGILFYLKKINEDKPGTKVIFTIKQSNNEVVATVESEVASADSARGLSKAFSWMLDRGARAREGKDEELLLKKTSVSPDGNKIIFNLTIPHQDIVDLIKKGMAPPPPTSSPS